MARGARLFHVYAAGNFIEATAETAYFQIGKSKYGKPIIDGLTRRSMPLSEAAKCALISIDSTIRSNLSVGPPLDLVVVRRNEFRVASHLDIDADNRYLQMIRKGWGEALLERSGIRPCRYVNITNVSTGVSWQT